jgi:multidrug transporter EmrE-like cation transporter
MVLGIVTLMSFVEFIGNMSFKTYARSNELNYLIIGAVAYFLMVKLLIETLRTSNLMYANGMWDGVSTILETVLAFILLRETLSNGYQWSGLGFIIVGTFLLNVGKIPY